MKHRHFSLLTANTFSQFTRKINDGCKQLQRLSLCSMSDAQPSCRIPAPHTGHQQLRCATSGHVACSPVICLQLTCLHHCGTDQISSASLTPDAMQLGNN
ncbi:hypothetical protein ACROYT_G031743 [Oculina patagonica]